MYAASAASPSRTMTAPGANRCSGNQLPPRRKPRSSSASSSTLWNRSAGSAAIAFIAMCDRCGGGLTAMVVRSAGGATSPICARTSATMAGPGYGAEPVSALYSIAPTPNTSVRWSIFDTRPWACSGAMYATVPMTMPSGSDRPSTIERSSPMTWAQPQSIT